jgi:hypothetical protein
MRSTPQHHSLRFQFQSAITKVWPIGLTDNFGKNTQSPWSLHIMYQRPLNTLQRETKWERADRRVPFGAQKTREVQGPTPSHFPK